MALVHKRNNRNIIVILVVGVVVAILLFVFRDRLFGGPETSGPLKNTPAVRDLPIVQDFGQDLFQDSRFSALRSFANVSLDTGRRGNPEPFKPFQ